MSNMRIQPAVRRFLVDFRRAPVSALFVLGLALGLPALVVAEVAGDKTADKKSDDAKVEIVDKVVEKKHRGVVGGVEFAYTTRSGTLVVRDEDGKAKAQMFFVAYTRDGVDGRDAAGDLHLQRRSRAPPRCGFTWAPSDRSAWTWARRASPPGRPIG